MTLILCPCKSLCSPMSTLPLNYVSVSSNTMKTKPHTNPMKLLSPTSQNSFHFTMKVAILGATHVVFCSRNGNLDGSSSNQLSQEALDDGIQEHGTLELLNKPLPVSIGNGLSSEVDKDTLKGSAEEDALAPFLKFLKENGSVDEAEEDGAVLEVSEERDYVDDENEEAKKVNAEYYEPKPGDFVVGVVVSGNENKLNVNVGAELLGTMLTKEVLPLYGKEMEYLLCDMNKVEENFMVQGRMGILKNDDAISGVPVLGSTVVEIGTVLYAEVLGRTLTGRPLLSSRRLFRRVAWHRLRQVKVLVVKSVFPDKISLSVADLESEPGLFLSNKEKVFLEADMMAKKYKEKLPPALAPQPSEPIPTSAVPFENEALYANWKWFKFEK